MMPEKFESLGRALLLIVICTLALDPAVAASELAAETPQAYSDKAWAASQRGDLEQAVTLWIEAAEGFRDARCGDPDARG